jgi:hypothetical protein
MGGAGAARCPYFVWNLQAVNHKQLTLRFDKDGRSLPAMIEQFRLCVKDVFGILADSKDRFLASPRRRWQLGVTTYLLAAFLAGNLISEIWRAFGGSIA